MLQIHSNNPMYIQKGNTASFYLTAIHCQTMFICFGDFSGEVMEVIEFTYTIIKGHTEVKLIDKTVFNAAF